MVNGEKYPGLREVVVAERFATSLCRLTQGPGLRTEEAVVTPYSNDWKEIPVATVDG